MRPALCFVLTLPLAACVGGASRIPPRHPAAASAPTTPLPDVGSTVLREDDVAPPSGHGHHHPHMPGHTMGAETSHD